MGTSDLHGSASFRGFRGIYTGSSPRDTRGVPPPFLRPRLLHPACDGRAGALRGAPLCKRPRPFL